MYSFVKQFILPPTFQLLAIGLGLLLTSWRRGVGVTLAAIGLIALWALSTPFVATRLIGALETTPTLTDERIAASPAQAIVILSADRVQEAPQFGGYMPGPLALQRLHYGAHLQHLTGLPVLITGGPDDPRKPPVAAVMAETLAVGFGVATAFREIAAQDTFQNAQFSGKILKDNGIDRVFLVTHAFHMPRAIDAFKAAGIGVTPAPTGFTKRSDMKPTAFIPTALGLMQSYLAMHEYAGEIWYHLRYHLLPGSEVSQSGVDPCVTIDDGYCIRYGLSHRGLAPSIL